ncbi:hypothetical protein PR202_gb19532 [Eleusine coracana subsp. coracana]|uniref:Uncharacterized protein n=1 Tax=Eleusine coracana subsp. coracana TaxID=191504 RepID=A0AAV5F695_ELECO|nr:hypothetical protein PR202_gb19532 [Eleusine coracana subsp. coracana]
MIESLIHIISHATGVRLSANRGRRARNATHIRTVPRSVGAPIYTHTRTQHRRSQPTGDGGRATQPIYAPCHAASAHLYIRTHVPNTGGVSQQGTAGAQRNPSIKRANEQEQHKQRTPLTAAPSLPLPNQLSLPLSSRRPAPSSATPRGCRPPRAAARRRRRRRGRRSPGATGRPPRCSRPGARATSAHAAARSAPPTGAPAPPPSPPAAPPPDARRAPSTSVRTASITSRSGSGRSGSATGARPPRRLPPGASAASARCCSSRPPRPPGSLNPANPSSPPRATQGHWPPVPKRRRTAVSLSPVTAASGVHPEQDGGRNCAEVAAALDRLAGTYERVETAKQREAARLEERRLEAMRDLEIERMRLLVDVAVTASVGVDGSSAAGDF